MAHHTHGSIVSIAVIVLNSDHMQEADGFNAIIITGSMADVVESCVIRKRADYVRKLGRLIHGWQVNY